MTLRSKEKLTEIQRIHINEIEFYIDQATRWLTGCFDKFVNERPDMGTKEDMANWEIKMAISHCKSLRCSLSV